MTIDDSTKAVRHPDTKSPVPALWEIEWRVCQVTAQQCGLELPSLPPESRLLEDLNIDSLEIVELIMALEEEFGVTIPDEAAGKTFTQPPVTLRDMAALVREHWGTGTPPRNEWRWGRPSLPAAEVVPFTQLGGRLDTDQWLDKPLYEFIGTNREGYRQYRRRTDGMRCVLIPAAEVQIGRTGPDVKADQQPAHKVHLSSFLMDAEPVSNAAYARFLNSLGKLPLRVLAEWCGVGDRDKRRAQFPLKQGRRGWGPLPGTERQPMILVSWFGANAYSLWAHCLDWRCYRGDGSMPEEVSNVHIKAASPQDDWMYSRLPSEVQWEYAASGGETRRVPIEEEAAVARHAVGNTYAADTLPAASVNETLGMSPFGLHHIAGNVWQWCRDWYAPDFYQRPEALLPDPQNAEPTGIRSERGGSWVGPPELAEPWHRRGRPPEAKGRCLGFRCVAKYRPETIAPSSERQGRGE